ncbi:hypothetical protein MMC30_009134 [Trapelia coarctata]|nr:hypothetical protein [Trapelia coarctata]
MKGENNWKAPPKSRLRHDVLRTRLRFGASHQHQRPHLHASTRATSLDAMVLVGLGILFASLTLLVLRSPRFKWREAIDAWKRGSCRDADKISAGRGEGEGRVEGDSMSLSAPNGDARKGGTRTLRRSPSTGATTGPRSPGAQRSTPTFILNNASSVITSRTGLPARQQATSTALGNPPTPPKPSDGRLFGLSTATKSPQPTSRTPQSASLLMPPPPPRPSTLRPLPKLNSYSLGPTPSLASTHRAPPRPSTSLSPPLAATSSTLPPAPRPSRKVILPPGHSPLDWAALTANPPSATFLRGAALPAHLIRVPPSMLKQQNGRKGRDAWGTWQGKVYNLTPYKKFHPGGEGELVRGAGKVGEAERLFMEVHPWVNWEGMLGECLVGVLVSEGEAEGGGGLEEMD